MQRSIDGSVLVGCGLVVAILILTAALTYRNTQRLTEDAGWVADTQEVLDLTAEVLLPRRGRGASAIKRNISEQKRANEEVRAMTPAALAGGEPGECGRAGSQYFRRPEQPPGQR
jgi:hypothetical protein